MKEFVSDESRMFFESASVVSPLLSWPSLDVKKNSFPRSNQIFLFE